MLADLYRSRNYQSEIAYMKNFIVFEPSSLRVQEPDILIRGEAVRDLFDQLYDQIMRKDGIQDQIVQNRVTKIARMLDMLTEYDNVVMTKFFNKIWRRYSAISNIAETFMDMETYFKYFPDQVQNKDQLVASRLDDSGDDEETGPAGTAAVESVESVEDIQIVSLDSDPAAVEAEAVPVEVN